MEVERGKVRTKEEIMACFKDGQTIAIGGQAAAYMPWELIDMLVESNVKHLTIYSIDSTDPGLGIGKLIDNGQVDKMVTTHIGTNPTTSRLWKEGKLEIEFSPMGTFIERVRCGGSGIGGFLTKTGLGTVVEEGKQIITVKGEKYILEEALHADVALSRCRRADLIGNLAYHGTGTASHPVVAACADLSIVQCDLLCDMHEISVDDIKVPGMYVDMLYTGGSWSETLVGPVKRFKMGGQ